MENNTKTENTATEKVNTETEMELNPEYKHMKIPTASNSLLVSNLPMMLALENILDYEFDESENIGRLWRLAEENNVVQNVESLEDILDRSKLFILEDMLDNNNGGMFCFSYQDETYEIRRERSFVSIRVKGNINSIDDLKPISKILDIYKEIGDVSYIATGARGTDINIAFITPNPMSKTYLNVGVITMEIGNTSQEEDAIMYDTELLRTGNENLEAAQLAYSSSVGHLFQEFNTFITKDSNGIAAKPDSVFTSNYALEKSSELIKKFLEVAQHSLAYGIEIDLVNILDKTLIAGSELGGRPVVLHTPTQEEIYAFSLYLLILNTTVIESCGNVYNLIQKTREDYGTDNEKFFNNPDNINEVAGLEVSRIANRSLLKIKDLLSLIVSGVKTNDGLSISIKEATDMLTIFNGAEYKDNTFIFNANLGYSNVYKMLDFLTSGCHESHFGKGLNIFDANIKSAISDSINRLLEEEEADKALKIKVETNYKQFMEEEKKEEQEKQQKAEDENIVDAEPTNTNTVD